MEKSNGLQESQKVGMIVTVGGQAAQIVFSMEQLKPTHVVFLATNTPQCRNQVDQLVRQFNLDASRYHSFETEDSPEEIGRVVEHCLQGFEWLTRQRGVPESAVRLDCTGGRKWMSAGAVVAAVHLGLEMPYVDVRYTEKPDLATGQKRLVADPDTMRIVQLGDVYEHICLPELDAGIARYNDCDYAGAREVFARVRAGSAVMQALAEALRCTADLADRLDRFLQFKEDLTPQFTSAIHGLTAVAKDKGYLRPLADVAKRLAALRERCAGVWEKRPTGELAAWLIMAARRRERRGQFDGAVLLYYRALELASQVWLWEWNDTQFNTSKPEWKKLPEGVVQQFRQQYPRASKLGLVEGYVLLRLLDHPEVRNLVTHDKKRNRWTPVFEDALSIRNLMVGEHGFNPVSAEEAKKLSRYAVRVAEQLTGLTKSDMESTFGLPDLPPLPRSHGGREPSP